MANALPEGALLAALPRAVKVHLFLTRDQLNLRAAFMQLRGKVGCRRAATNHDYRLAIKFLCLDVAEAMRHKFGGEGCEYPGHPRIVRDTDREDDAARRQLFAVFQAQPEAIVGALDIRDELFFQLRNHAIPEREAVGSKYVELHRHLHVGVFEAALGAEFFQRELTIGVGNVGGEAIGLQAHALGHMQQPALHRATENAERNALATKVGSEGKPVWAGADDSDLSHEGEPLL